MSYCGRVSATRVAASTVAVSRLCDLLAVQYVHGATGGVVTIRDGAVSASVLLELSTPATASGGVGEMYLPGQGIRADTGLYVDLGAGATAVTVVYG